jgi:hypothetical protein
MFFIFFFCFTFFFFIFSFLEFVWALSACHAQRRAALAAGKKNFIFEMKFRKKKDDCEPIPNFKDGKLYGGKWVHQGQSLPKISSVIDPKTKARRKAPRIVSFKS